MEPQIGILYSATTGVVCRVINTDDPAHLDWLQQNLKNGEGLLRINKADVGADDDDVPNLDFLIPYIKGNHGLDLKFGITSSVVDDSGKVVDVVICCPDLYKVKLENDAVKENRDPHIVLKGKPVADKGYFYDSKKNEFFSPAQVDALPIDQKPVFDKKDLA